MFIVKNALTKTNICRRLFMDTLKHFPNLIMCYRYQLFTFRVPLISLILDFILFYLGLLIFL